MNTGGSVDVITVGGDAENTAVGLLSEPLSGVEFCDEANSADAPLGFCLTSPSVLVLAWLVAAALAAVEVSGMLSSLVLLALAASEYAVSAPVSAGTALCKVELGAAGSVVGWA